MEFSYIKPEKKEVLSLVYVCVVLAAMFSFLFLRFDDSNRYFFGVFIKFFIFLFFLEFLRLIFMKIIGYRNAFEIIFYQMRFDQFWLNSWNRTSYYLRGKPEDGLVAKGVNKITFGKSIDFKGIPMSIVSILIYIISFGFFIFPSIWNYKIKKIHHLHVGTKQKFEYILGHMFNQDISDYRISKALFGGFLFYFVFGLFMKLFLELFNEDFFNWFSFTLYWIAFWSIIPIFGTVGFELLRRSYFAWISAFVILVLGMISVLVFEDMGNILGFTIISSIIVLLYLLWRYIVYD